MELEERRAFAENGLLAAADRQRLFDALWKEWRPRLEAYLRSFSGLSAEDREELAGDALLRAFERADRYRPERPLEPWLVAVARRMALSRLRSPARRAETPAAPEELLGEADGRRPGPEAECIREEERIAVANLVRSLPERERELAFLVYGRSMSLVEAARATGSPLGTVKWRMSRLRELLRRATEVEDAE
ncbi:MAG: sigma-70 family RNA polymerase sigma factor [Spirochaetes bacterium]|nr:sigma-70 family RNA polymerase sigma factor [Spirochaetota bacterium]MBU1081693.1 sigma-70 family RNA polymerase sigma factor [Spirochaetota bacterium]